MAGPQSERLGLQMDLGTHSTAKQQPRQFSSSTEIRELKLWQGSLRKMFGVPTAPLISSIGVYPAQSSLTM